MRFEEVMFNEGPLDRVIRGVAGAAALIAATTRER